MPECGCLNDHPFIHKTLQSSIHLYKCACFHHPSLNQSSHQFIPVTIHECMCTFTHIYIYIHTCVHPFIHSIIQTFIHPLIHSYIHTPIHTLIHPNIHSSIHTYTLPSIYPSICSLPGPQREKTIVHSFKELTVV